MSDVTRRVNEFFRTASRKDVGRIEAESIMSERQSQIFTMFYVSRIGVVSIADKLCLSVDTVYKELASIRKKIISLI